jgi:hypothetical protein
MITLILAFIINILLRTLTLKFTNLDYKLKLNSVDYYIL